MDGILLIGVEARLIVEFHRQRPGEIGPEAGLVPFLPRFEQLANRELAHARDSGQAVHLAEQPFAVRLIDFGFEIEDYDVTDHCLALLLTSTPARSSKNVTTPEWSKPPR